MQSLKSEPFSTLIPLLPVDKHAVRVKASNWEEHFSGAGLDDEFQEIFGGRREVRLTRQEIRDRAQGRRKSIEILLWGYPSGMRGNHHLDYLNNLQDIVDCAASDAVWPDYFAALNGIGSLGISTVTKIAYFFGRSFGGHKAVILDNRLIGVISRSGWNELADIGRLTYGNAVKKYVDYLGAMSKVADEIQGAEPEHLEFFLFTLGDAFKSNCEQGVGGQPATPPRVGD